MSQGSSQPWPQPLTQPQSVQITPRVEGVFDLCPRCRNICASDCTACRYCGQQRLPLQATFLDGELVEVKEALTAAVHAAVGAVQAHREQTLPLPTVVEETRSSNDGMASMLSSNPRSMYDPPDLLPHTCVLGKDFDTCPTCQSTYQKDATFCQQCGEPREYDSEGNELIHIHAEYLTVTDPEKKAKLEEVKAKLHRLLGQEPTSQADLKPEEVPNGTSPVPDLSEIRIQEDPFMSPTSTFALTSAPGRLGSQHQDLDETSSLPWEQISPKLECFDLCNCGDLYVPDEGYGLFCEKCGEVKPKTHPEESYPANLDMAGQAREARELHPFSLFQQNIAPGLLDQSSASAETISLPDSPVHTSNGSTGLGLDWFGFLFALDDMQSASATESRETSESLHFIRHEWNIDDTQFTPEKRSWPEKHHESITGSAIPALPSAEISQSDSPDLCRVM